VSFVKKTFILFAEFDFGQEEDFDLLPGVSDTQKVALLAAAQEVFPDMVVSKVAPMASIQEVLPEMDKPVFAKKSAPG
jgi:hypothetical protein